MLQWIDRARAQPAATAILTDFDGTLAEIVLDPSAATPFDGVCDVLDALARSYATVAVISGRPVAFLQQALPATVRMSGLYGLEEVCGGTATIDPAAAPWRVVVEETAGRGRAALPDDVTVESKGLSVTLHFRKAPHREQLVRDWARREAQATGLRARDARSSVELHPPLEVDKGTVVERYAAGARHVCFLGDDVGDLPAFEALSSLAARGVDVLRVGVASSELAPELRDTADQLVVGPRGARDFLASLLL